jgi:phosphoribosyl-AMP cyclohydrolase
MLTFDRQGLIPVAIQDDATHEVLMLAFMNEEAFELTRATGYTHFYSRSRNAIWRKGEQSGHVQEVRAIYVNCEENSLLIRVTQHGGAACHTGYRSCYYRQLLPDGSYETVAERVFDPDEVYGMANEQSAELESALRTLYNVYLYLRDRDLSEESNTSRLLHESFDPESGTRRYLLARLADELQELMEVQSGEHRHAGREPDTILEASQVGYWLMLLAATYKLAYHDFLPHEAEMQGYEQIVLRRDAMNRVHEPGVPNASDQENPPERDTSHPYENLWESATQECLSLLSAEERAKVIEGLQAGFALIGRACAEARVSPVAPAEYDLEQMRKKGLVE